jgi:hypothetical protein
MVSIHGFDSAFRRAAIARCVATFSAPTLVRNADASSLGYLLTLFQANGLNPSLALTRDRLMGVLLGIVLMWLVFDSRWIAAGRRGYQLGS